MYIIGVTSLNVWSHIGLKISLWQDLNWRVNNINISKITYFSISSCVRLGKLCIFNNYFNLFNLLVIKQFYVFYVVLHTWRTCNDVFFLIPDTGNLWLFFFVNRTCYEFINFISIYYTHIYIYKYLAYGYHITLPKSSWMSMRNISFFISSIIEFIIKK